MIGGSGSVRAKMPRTKSSPGIDAITSSEGDAVFGLRGGAVGHVRYIP